MKTNETELSIFKQATFQRTQATKVICPSAVSQCCQYFQMLLVADWYHCWMGWRPYAQSKTVYHMTNSIRQSTRHNWSVCTACGIALLKENVDVDLLPRHTPTHTQTEAAYTHIRT